MSEETKVANDPVAQNVDQSIVSTLETQGAEPKEDVKKEASPYEAELTRLNALVKEKTGALKEERERRKQAEVLLKSKTEVAESAVEDLDNKDAFTRQIEELVKKQELLEAKLNQKAIDSEINEITKDSNEQKLIRYHLENSIKTTGDIAQDIINAHLLANRHKLYEAGKKEGLEAKKEEIMAGFSAAGSSGGKAESKKVDPLVLELLNKLDPSGKAAKYL